jgi:hypothetical protein
MVAVNLKQIQVLLTLVPRLCIPCSDTLRAGRFGDRISLQANFPQPLRLVLGPKQPPIQCVAGHLQG